MRRLFLGLAVAATTLVPGVVSADDTQIADFIQSRLQAEQQQGRLSGFNVDMQVEQGTVWFKGTVSNATQEKLILQTAQQAGHLGVVQVVDDIEVAAPAKPTATKPTIQPELKPVAFQQQNGSIAASTGIKQAIPASFQVGSGTRVPTSSVIGAPIGTPVGAPIGTPVGTPIGAPAPSGEIISGEPLPFATSGDPLPLATAGAGVPSGSPNLPGYAWPGYAAHPNFGAVSYPRQYSASAWPYIGPFYPYPQVPLGWRKVSLEWDDGFWYLDFHDKSRH